MNVFFLAFFFFKADVETGTQKPHTSIFISTELCSILKLCPAAALGRRLATSRKWSSTSRKQKRLG